MVRRTTSSWLTVTLLGVMTLAGCDCGKPPQVWEPTPYALEIPPFFPPMDIPADNPLTEEGVHLGRLLFWETRLSQDNSMSCGTCHLPEVSFADPEPYSTGVTGAVGTRNAMALINMGWASSFFWDGRALTLEEQIFEPIPHPAEMNQPWSEAVAKLQADDTSINYPQRFFDAFGTTDITADLVTKAIAQFVRTMISADSKFDQWRRGEVELTDSEYNGYQMFLREGGDPEVVPGGQFGADCFHCHGEAGLQFTDHLFHNNGLDPTFEADPGRVLVTGNPLDSGLFRTPTLRNVALSAPYMHDGRFSTLEDVVEHYNTGGVASSTIDPFMKYAAGGLSLAPSQKEDLIAFLHTLTDTVFIANPAFQDPH
ncbi:MAG: cytochrome c peroxidase [Bacteroidota bacterium]|nr:cytochrome c peroxidase [Bacteroidota bacterium]